jgi:hypothetical protein
MPHHITQRKMGRARVFDSDQDWAVFLDLLAGYSQQFGLAIWGLLPDVESFPLSCGSQPR